MAASQGDDRGAEQRRDAKRRALLVADSVVDQLQPGNVAIFPAVPLPRDERWAELASAPGSAPAAEPRPLPPASAAAGRGPVSSSLAPLPPATGRQSPGRQRDDSGSGPASGVDPILGAQLLADANESLAAASRRAEQSPQRSLTRNASGGLAAALKQVPVRSQPPARPRSPSPDAAAERAAAIKAAEPQVWRALMSGDLPELQGLCAAGLLPSGQLRDHRGHSVLWNAIAFEHAEVALWLLRRFPPGGLGGVDVGEIHEARRDSLLHLTLYITDFSERAAELFQLLLRAPGRAPLDLTNQHGQTFAHIAASRLNLWALRLALAVSPEAAPLLRLQDQQGATPLQLLLKSSGLSRVQKRRRTQLPPTPEKPAWSPFAGLVADGPAPTEEGTNSLLVDIHLELVNPGGELVRLAAHRVVVGACSEPLHEEMRKLPRASGLRLQPWCTSDEVVRAMLRYCYTGEVPDPYLDPSLRWQFLQFAVHYDLPAPLRTFAKRAFFALEDFGAALPEVLAWAERLGVPAPERRLIALELLIRCRDPGGEAWQLARSNQRCLAEALACALSELERKLLEDQQEAAEREDAEELAQQHADDFDESEAAAMDHYRRQPVVS